MVSIYDKTVRGSNSDEWMVRGPAVPLEQRNINDREPCWATQLLKSNLQLPQLLGSEYISPQPPNPQKPRNLYLLFHFISLHFFYIFSFLK